MKWSCKQNNKWFAEAVEILKVFKRTGISLSHGQKRLCLERGRIQSHVSIFLLLKINISSSQSLRLSAHFLRSRSDSGTMVEGDIVNVTDGHQTAVTGGG